MTYINDKQYGQLLHPINARRVHQKDGMSHMEAYDIRAHLNRIFGFGRWSADVIDMQLVAESVAPNKSGKDSFTVIYRAGLRLTVCAPDGTALATYTEYAAGDAINFPVFKRGDAHDFAIKTAESQALKRAAVNLGDQFGLSLYNKGNHNALVGKTLNPVVGEPDAEPVDDGAPVIEREQSPEGEPAEPQGQQQNQPQGPSVDWPKEILKARNHRESLLALLDKAKGLGAPQTVIDQIISEGNALTERNAA